MNDISYLDVEVLRGLAVNNLKIKNTAEYLHLSRHTIDYHVRNIKKVTGLDPLNFCELYKLLFRYNLLYLGNVGELIILDGNEEI